MCNCVFNCSIYQSTTAHATYRILTSSFMWCVQERRVRGSRVRGRRGRGPRATQQRRTRRLGHATKRGVVCSPQRGPAVSARHRRATRTSRSTSRRGAPDVTDSCQSINRAVYVTGGQSATSTAVVSVGVADLRGSANLDTMDGQLSIKRLLQRS